MRDQISNKAADIIKELESTSNSKPLEAWMAHYIAELMVRVETASTVAEQNELQDQCAKIVTELWEIIYGVKARQLDWQLQQSVFGQNLVSQYKDELHTLLNGTDTDNELSDIDSLLLLVALEQQILYLLTISLELKKAADENDEFASTNMFTMQKANTVREALEEIIPTLLPPSLDDYDLMFTFTLKSLRIIHSVRSTILDEK